MATTTIGGNISSTAVLANLDHKYGPYNSLQDAYDTLGPGGIDKITIGLTVGIIENGEITEYWFKEGLTLQDLVKKSDSTESFISSLPVSDGTDIGEGEIYIDSTDGSIKVKLVTI